MSADPERWYLGVLFTKRWLWPRGQWEYTRERAQESARHLWPHASELAVINHATGERWQYSADKRWTRQAEAPPPPPAVSKDPERGPRMWWIEE